MQRNPSELAFRIFPALAFSLATLALVGLGQGSSLGQEGRSTESKPTAPSSDKGPTPQDPNPTTTGAAPETKSSGGEQLSKKEVSTLPLNKRDFSQLLLLAAGTMTDSNGAANFTQQFAVNGQRGATTVFAMDGIDTTDPELGR